MTEPIDRMPLAGIGPAQGPVHGPVHGPVQSNVAPPDRTDSPAFRALLESLEKLSRGTSPAREVHDPESLKRAVADADQDFQQVMDLRRRLEDAFRQRTS